MEDGGEVFFAVFWNLKPDIAQQQHTSEAKRTQWISHIWIILLFSRNAIGNNY